jgi:hypothetical protein|tara:strand:+ start:689 stop:976 length:288 start_codon:yes stop_codon:yes gene_type:complete
MKLGDRYDVENLDGATLCGYCQNYFKGDGDMDTCNECIELAKSLFTNKYSCSICHKEFKDYKYSHNAQPVADGQCCDECNATVVIPQRFKNLGNK